MYLSMNKYLIMTSIEYPRTLENNVLFVRTNAEKLGTMVSFHTGKLKRLTEKAGAEHSWSMTTPMIRN